MKINKLLSNINYTPAKNREIEYLVIHYVGATGGAKNNCLYFQNVYRGASAHYFVDHSGEVWQCVEDKNISWHCGSDNPKINNSNSIGIEMCCRKNSSGWYFEEATVKATKELAKEIMAKYNIPIERVVRHYDVSGKNCPEPYVRNSKAWESFKAGLAPSTTIKASFTVGDKVKLAPDAVYYDGKQMPAWVKNSTLYLRELKGDRAIISTLAVGAITGAVNIKYLK